MQHFLLSLENDALRFPDAPEQAAVNKRLYGTGGVAGGAGGEDLCPVPPSCPYAANGIVPLEHRQTCAHRSPSHQHVTDVLVALRDVATCCPWLCWLLSVPCPPPQDIPGVPLLSPSSPCSQRGRGRCRPWCKRLASALLVSGAPQSSSGKELKNNNNKMYLHKPRERGAGASPALMRGDHR